MEVGTVAESEMPADLCCYTDLVDFMCSADVDPESILQLRSHALAIFGCAVRHKVQGVNASIIFDLTCERVHHPVRFNEVWP
eukprot:13750166-Ditylum_brightwellii.AAC.1